MSASPSVSVLASDYGYHPSILPLNKSLRPSASTLRLTLEIDWDPPDPAQALSNLESDLLRVCPSLGEHQCRGPVQYHVHGPSPGWTSKVRGRWLGVEPGLALAHLIEHVMIDAVAFVTGLQRVSGVTGAHQDSERRFDVYVECPDYPVSLLARYVGISWVLTLLQRGSLDSAGAQTLRVARLIYNLGPRTLDPSLVAVEVGMDEADALEILERLEVAGFARRNGYTVNLSGTPYFRLSSDGARRSGSTI